MKESDVTAGIDKCLVDRFGGAEVPTTKELKIEKISDIPDIIKELKQLKYGPKLKFHETSEVTSNYQAGFSGKNGKGFAESIFMILGNKYMTHKAIRDELKIQVAKERMRGQDSPCRALAETVQQLEKNCSYCSLADSLKKSIKNLASKETLESKLQITKFKEKGVTAITRSAEMLVQKAQEGECGILSDELKNLFTKNYDKRLQTSIFSIWLVAESFRYPPMLLYSVFLLHLYLEGDIELDEFGRLLPEDDERGMPTHPAEPTGSQLALFYCYVRDTNSKSKANEEFIAANRQGVEANVKKIEQQKLEILRKVRNSFYYKFAKKIPNEEVRAFVANSLFLRALRKYVSICIGPDSMDSFKTDYKRLIESLGPFKSLPRR